jgi:hypothetical protein
MTDFRIGDKVRYIGPVNAPPGLQPGEVGEVCQIDPMSGAPGVQFEGRSGAYIIYGLSELEMVKEGQRPKYK